MKFAILHLYVFLFVCELKGFRDGKRSIGSMMEGPSIFFFLNRTFISLVVLKFRFT